MRQFIWVSASFGVVGPSLVHAVGSKQFGQSVYTAPDGANFLQTSAAELYADGSARSRSAVGFFRSMPARNEDSFKTYSVAIVREIPHEGAPWTQGLEFDGTNLVETSGDYPPGRGSFVRYIDPATGKELRRISDGLANANSHPRFIEGISKVGNSWFASTYIDKVVIEYDSDMNLLKEHSFPWEGWGLAHTSAGDGLLATNSTEYINFLDMTTFQASKVLTATCLGRKIKGLNELEMVHDFMGEGPRLLGNLINTRVIMVLDPSNGKCTGVFSLDGPNMEAEANNEGYGFHVANGIAYNQATGSFFVTGKNWKSIFEVRLTEVSTTTDAQPQAARFHDYLRQTPPVA